MLPRRPPLSCMLLTGALLLMPATLRAASNDGASAYLTWNASEKSASDLPAPSAVANLYVFLERAAGLCFKGAEIDLSWCPADSLAGDCFAHVGTAYRASESACSYLNRGTTIPVVLTCPDGDATARILVLE